MAVVSIGPYASLHLAPDRQSRQHPTTQFFRGRMPFLLPSQQSQSTKGASTEGDKDNIKNNQPRGTYKAGELHDATVWRHVVPPIVSTSAE